MSLRKSLPKLLVFVFLLGATASKPALAQATMERLEVAAPTQEDQTKPIAISSALPKPSEAEPEKNDQQND